MPQLERTSFEFSFGLQMDFNSFILGDRLGEGVGREVFEDRFHPTRVFKLENYGVQNFHEWQLWGAVQGTEWEQWFAPVYWLSSYGRVLIQARTRQPVVGRNTPAFPTEIPSFMDDVKPANMGIYRGRWVFHDYGDTKALKVGLAGAKMILWAEAAAVFTSPKAKPEWELP
ncbi:hypothetical protein SAMN04488503_2228 [Humidesulfovibrio mexicanus]|uniref:Uncharacterized protein n=1 Tax=Humidesulfovibrio mexicanus TaxID=147047 RepID=A0A239AWA5_9BACT|nr:hypothetical protein [Humidesulfovibrio mexicanus]SNR99233.1 hypothetical protein SAMN04488503_2228 [Humidesulfovibrio mexicanus]